jgi:hypothetical protein
MWQCVQYNIDSKLNADMDLLYTKLNRKLDALTQHARIDNKLKEHTQMENNRVINMSNITFTKEQISTLKLGPQYAIERNPKQYIIDLIIDTENAIKHLQGNMQNTFRYMAAKKIKQVKESNRHNTMHRGYQYNINQIKKILQRNKLTIAKADKSKAIVIIDKTTLIQKIDTFIQENNIVKLNKDPTDTYQRQIQQTMQKCKDLIDKHRSKYMLNIKPTAPKINAYIKTHKDNNPIRPVIDNTQAPSYKIAKFLDRRIKEYVNLPNTYTVQNSNEMVQELQKLHTAKNHKMITLDIKDLYVNLPKQGIIQSTATWMDKNKVCTDIKEQITQMLKVIIEQNYFQHNNQYFKQQKGIAMGSHISGTLAEIYLQLIEERYIKHWVESQNIVYYKRYVDDIFIIFDNSRINEITINNCMNSIDENLEFKITEETNNSVKYLDMTINRSINGIEISIYRKPTSTDITIQHTSNHPQDHKNAAYRYYINRMITLPNTERARTQERKYILSTAQHNGFPAHKIIDMEEKITQNKDKRTKTNETQERQIQKKWVTFTYHSPLIRKVTNLFNNTEVRIAFKATNTIYQQLTEKTQNKNPSGIYEIKCNTCNRKYVGQSGRPITTRHKEHIRYIRSNNTTSAYAAHILNNRHEYGAAENTLKLIHPCRKGQKMNNWENLYIQIYRQRDQLITEQQVNEPNPLYELARTPQDTNISTRSDTVRASTPHV